MSQSIKLSFCISVLFLKFTFSGTGVNFANNNGGGGVQNRSRIYSAPQKTRGFHFAAFSPPNNHYENICIFFSCVPLFNSVSKEIFLGIKNTGKVFAPPPPVTPVFSDKRRIDKKK
jgi:hypothetical protein